MAERHITPDIVIFGAGIAGLWAFHRFKAMGYDALLLEASSIGGGQSIASQGIIHSGLKYAFAGKINKLAQSISAMPDIWKAALNGEGDVDLSAARMNAPSQHLLIPWGFVGGLMKLVMKNEVQQKDWPDAIKTSGFKGNMIRMDEPVLDVPSVLRALAEPYKNSIRKIDTPTDPFGFLERHDIKAQHIICTSAASNAKIAKAAGHDAGLETQARPLLMGMLKPAPFALYAHLVGASDKPVLSITTHKTEDGDMVWYLGGQAAERSKNAPPEEVFEAARAAFAKYLPQMNISNVQWATLPIDRIEGKSGTAKMPDTPTIHSVENVHYCWPTKLTFAPLLSDRLLEKLSAPSGHQNDWSFLPEVDYSPTPWDKTHWTK